MIRHSLVGLTLKLGIILPFIYFGLMSVFSPRSVSIFYPDFILDLIGLYTTAYIGAILALVVAVWIFWGKRKFSSSLLAAIIIAGSILFRIDEVHYVFGAIPLFTSALALSFRYYPRNRGITLDESLLTNHQREQELAQEEAQVEQSES
jgi:hypothetical protein